MKWLKIVVLSRFLVQNNKLKAGKLVWIVIYKFFYEIF